jgi:hypothetical protein
MATVTDGLSRHISCRCGAGYIAAIAAAHAFASASRDGSAFKAAGLTVIDPWTALD